MKLGKILLRLATIDDAQLLFEWRSDIQTRQASHHEEEISFADHHVWFTKSLENPNRKIYIALMNGKPVGTVRSDLFEGISELSWTVNPAYRGQGIGTKMVTLLAKKIDGPIKAEVKAINLASRHISEACGMILKESKNGILYYIKSEKNSDV